MTERWKAIAEYPDYAVSDHGRIQRLTSRTCAKAGTVLKTSLSNGYPSVSLCWFGKITNHHVHVLVAEAFIGPRPSGHNVNHKDAVRANNAHTNLEWMTQSANVQHAYDLGLRDCSGEGNGQSKLTAELVADLRLKAVGAKSGFYSAEARRLGLNSTTVRQAVIGRTWGHLPGAVKRAMRSLLSDQCVAEIREEYTGRYGQCAELARQHGVSFYVMQSIVRGRSRRPAAPV